LLNRFDPKLGFDIVSSRSGNLECSLHMIGLPFGKPSL
jgi:hypothetical protein